ncbi:hypothetical protein ILYODFUR_033834 [Ilyodon furcidens]|uniref:Uncharacterized protein n=1 Tax=Ilyodon furcidens TaxID=33524 RepID=A0ABV0TP17_9TELE
MLEELCCFHSSFILFKNFNSSFFGLKAQIILQLQSKTQDELKRRLQGYRAEAKGRERRRQFKPSLPSIIKALNSVQFSFIYIAPIHNTCRLKTLHKGFGMVRVVGEVRLNC